MVEKTCHLKIAETASCCKEVAFEGANGFVYLDEPITITTSSNTYYYLTNSQYSVMDLTDSSGNLVQEYAYDPYGKKTVLRDGGIDQPYGFTGRRLDEESGLWYFRFRMSSDELGRFVSQDPVGYEDGMNLYCAWFVPKDLDPEGLTLILNHNHGKDKHCSEVVDINMVLYKDISQGAKHLPPNNWGVNLKSRPVTVEGFIGIIFYTIHEIWNYRKKHGCDCWMCTKPAIRLTLSGHGGKEYIRLGTLPFVDAIHRKNAGWIFNKLAKLGNISEIIIKSCTRGGSTANSEVFDEPRREVYRSIAKNARVKVTGSIGVSTMFGNTSGSNEEFMFTTARPSKCAEKQEITKEDKELELPQLQGWKFTVP